MSKLKPATAAALVLGMAFTAAPLSAFAAIDPAASSVQAKEEQPDNILSQQEVQERVAKLVEIPAGYELSQASYRPPTSLYPESKGMWHLQYRLQEGGQDHMLFLTVDANTGNLINFDRSEMPEADGQPLTEEAAQEKALALIRHLSPDKAEQVEQVELLDPEQGKKESSDQANDVWTYRWVQMIDGVPYTGNSIYLTLTASGELVRYSLSWTDGLEFPSAKPEITKEQADQAFADSFQVLLQYMRVPERFSDAERLVLIYGQLRSSILPSFPNIDAQTGEAFTNTGDMVTPQPLPDLQPIAEQAAGRDQELTKEEAVARVERLQLNLEGFTLNDTSYQVDSQNSDRHIWQLNYSKPNQSGSAGFEAAFVSLDAMTGDLISFNVFHRGNAEGEEDRPQTVDEAQAQERAIDFIRQALPSYADKLVLNPAADNGLNLKTKNYHYSFAYLVDGLPVANLMVSVMIDAKTGQVQDFTNRLNSFHPLTPYPDQAQAMSLEEARRLYLDHYPLHLQYVSVHDPKSPYFGVKEVRLAYAPYYTGGAKALNAITGDWIDPNDPDSANGAKATDIQDHWAKDSLQKMVSLGVFEPVDGKVHPNEAVTRGDWFRDLMIALQMGRSTFDGETFPDVPRTHEDYAPVEEALQRGWMTHDEVGATFRPDDNLTRAQLAEWVVGLLDYREMAAATDAFTKRFEDVGQDEPNFGNISVVAALSLMNGSGDKFGPNETVTRAQAAVVIDRILQKFRDDIK
ncbi:MAG TPA: S-layer homology domain-containing protein [Bacilli bacterium]|nr:S-layer homology domain-containing protein [Bacilli bacterium]